MHILADNDCVKNWPQVLCLTENLLKSSVKQLLGALPNTLLFGNSIAQDPVIIQEMDQRPDGPIQLSICAM